MDTLKTISNARLGAHLEAAVKAQAAALDLDREDLYTAACEVTLLFQREILRRQQETAAQGQDAYDRFLAELNG